MKFLIEPRGWPCAVIETDEGADIALELWFLQHEKEEKPIPGTSFEVLVTPILKEPVKMEIRRTVTSRRLDDKQDPVDIPF